MKRRAEERERGAETSLCKLYVAVRETGALGHGRISAVSEHDHGPISTHLHPANCLLTGQYQTIPQEADLM